MTPEELKVWRNGLGITQEVAAETMGIGLKTYQQMERGISFATEKPVQIDTRTALACSAIAAGLKPWGK